MENGLLDLGDVMFEDSSFCALLSVRKQS